MTAWRALLSQPSAVLLAVQLAAVLLFPFLGGSPIGIAALSTVGYLILFLAVRAVQSTPALTWIAVLLGIPLVGLTVVEVLDPTIVWVSATSAILHAAFYVYTTYALLRYMFNDRFITTDELWATAATFTVVAWAFSYIFLAVQIIWPGSFVGLGGEPGPFTWFELLFVSFTNLTSVGMSDISAVTPHARSWVMLEQFVGILYVALVISRIVGLTITRQRDLGARK